MKGYTWYVQQYEAVGVAPPPQPYITIAKALAGEGQDGQGTQAAELPVKDGYQAISGFVIVSYTVESGYMVFVTVGKGIHQFDGTTALWRAIPMANEVENIPFTLLVSGVHHYTVAVEVHCQRTQRALDAWKLETHAAILQAYQQKLRDYEDAVAQRQIQAGIQIEGRNPGEKRAPHPHGDQEERACATHRPAVRSLWGHRPERGRLPAARPHRKPGPRGATSASSRTPSNGSS